MVTRFEDFDLDIEEISDIEDESFPQLPNPQVNTTTTRNEPKGSNRQGRSINDSVDDCNSEDDYEDDYENEFEATNDTMDTSKKSTDSNQKEKASTKQDGSYDTNYDEDFEQDASLSRSYGSAKEAQTTFQVPSNNSMTQINRMSDGDDDKYGDTNDLESIHSSQTSPRLINVHHINNDANSSITGSNKSIDLTIGTLVSPRQSMLSPKSPQESIYAVSSPLKSTVQFSPTSNHRDDLKENRFVNVSKGNVKVISDQSSPINISHKSWKEASLKDEQNKSSLNQQRPFPDCPIISTYDHMGSSFDVFSKVKRIDESFIQNLSNSSKVTSTSRLLSNKSPDVSAINTTASSSKTVDAMLKSLINEAAMGIIKENDRVKMISDTSIPISVPIAGLSQSYIDEIDKDIHEVENNIKIEDDHPEFRQTIKSIRKLYNAHQFQLHEKLSRFPKGAKKSTNDGKKGLVQPVDIWKQSPQQRKSIKKPLDPGASSTVTRLESSFASTGKLSNSIYNDKEKDLQTISTTRPDILDKCEAYYAKFLEKMTGILP